MKKTILIAAIATLGAASTALADGPFQFFSLCATFPAPFGPFV